MDNLKELELLCKPIIEFMSKNCNPYIHIVVSSDSIKIVNEIAGVPLKKEAD